MNLPAKLKAAVITGGHPMNVTAFTDLLRSYPDVEFYFHSVDEWLEETSETRRGFASVLFYHFDLGEPSQGWRDATEEIPFTICDLVPASRCR